MRGDLLIMNNIYIYIYVYIWRSVLIFIAISGHVVPFPYCGLLMDVVVCVVMDVVDRLFVAMFDYLNNNFAKELEAVGRQYPFQDLGILGLQHSVCYMMLMDDWCHEFLCRCFFKRIYHT